MIQTYRLLIRINSLTPPELNFKDIFLRKVPIIQYLILIDESLISR